MGLKKCISEGLTSYLQHRQTTGIHILKIHTCIKVRLYFLNSRSLSISQLLWGGKYKLGRLANKSPSFLPLEVLRCRGTNIEATPDKNENRSVLTNRQVLQRARVYFTLLSSYFSRLMNTKVLTLL